jgi:hypothetical protein
MTTTYTSPEGSIFNFVDIIFDPLALGELLRGPEGDVAKYVTRVCVRAQTEAQRLCPVDTGRLRASIRFMVQEEDGEIVGYVGSDVNYAIYVELGTRYMNSEPYLRPGVDAAIGMADV